MVAAPPLERLSAQAYFETYPESMLPMELIAGEVIPMPAPKNVHQEVLFNLSLILGNIVQSNALGQLRFAPCDVVFDAQNVLQPDLFFVSKDNTRCAIGVDDRWYGVPDLCIEILSSNPAHDKVTKFKLYEQFGVREYWIVDPHAQQIHVWTGEEGHFIKQGEYKIGQELTAKVLPLALAVKQIFP